MAQTSLRCAVGRALPAQVAWALLSALWNLAGVYLVAQGERAPGPTASIMGASLLVAIAAALVLTIDRMTLLYAALSGVAATIALAAVVNAFVQDPRGIGNSCGSGSGRPVRLAGRVVAGRALRSVRARHHPGLIRANTAIERGEENPHAN